MLLTLSLLHDETGEPSGIASISKDITQQKQAEGEARDAAGRRDQFLAMLSHELRNPLGAIMNATRLFERAGGDGNLQRKACPSFERQAEQMARLLDDLLDVARVTQGKIQIRHECVDLRSLVQEAVQVMRPLLESCKHSLTVVIPDHPVFVEGDVTRLLQVQQNLLANAAKYTPAGGNLRITLREENDQALLAVQDNGMGIAPGNAWQDFRTVRAGSPTAGTDRLGHGHRLDHGQNDRPTARRQRLGRERWAGPGEPFRSAAAADRQTAKSSARRWEFRRWAVADRDRGR